LGIESAEVHATRLDFPSFDFITKDEMYWWHLRRSWDRSLHTS